MEIMVLYDIGSYQTGQPNQQGYKARPTAPGTVIESHIKANRIPALEGQRKAQRLDKSVEAATFYRVEKFYTMPYQPN
jgi:hypothetical protein